MTTANPRSTTRPRICAAIGVTLFLTTRCTVTALVRSTRKWSQPQEPASSNQPTTPSKLSRKPNLTLNGETKQARANWGTTGANVKNAIVGVTEGFSKKLDIQGIGYKAAMEGASTIVLNLGFTHPIKYAIPEGVKVIVEKNVVTVSGFDRYQVGQTAADIRAYKKPEPYQGKGIRYVGEQVRRKAGKKVAGTGTAA